ncbi:MAG: hypothetical protein WC891_04220 [Actinomycetota bacterium]
MNCVHCGAELSDREEICTLCGKLAKVPDSPAEPAELPAAPSEQPSAPDQAAASAPVDKTKASKEGAAFCTECKKFVYLDANGRCDRGHPVSSMAARGSQMPDQAARSGRTLERSVPSGTYPGDIPVEGMFADNSGQGSMSSLPAELEGVNWGAFLMTWIWGIGNRVWLSFLVFVPGGYYVMPWVLLIKGNEWAWKNKRWDSIQEFQEVQRKWAIAGIALTVLGIAFFCLAWVLLVSTGTVSNTGQAGGQIS